MPIMDGCTATQKIRQWEIETGQPRQPIIALTASVFESNRQHCLSVGMDGFLTKPIMFDSLKETLSQWLDASATTATSLPAVKPVDVPQVLAILRELIPALMQNRFNAISIFNKLREVLAGTDLDKEIVVLATPLWQFQFKVVLKQLRQMMATNDWKEENL